MMNDKVKPLITFCQSNERSIRRHAEGLSNEQSCLQPQFEAISFNWTLGHIVHYRVVALQMMGVSFAWDMEKTSPYGHNPAGIAGPEDGRSLADLLMALGETGRLLEEALLGAAPEVLDEIIQTFFGDQARVDFVGRLVWHETYHVGQLGLLRSLVSSPGGAG